jgi:hypothetical protein
MVTYGDLRARAQELLSPVGGTALSSKDAASLKYSVVLCKTSGGGIALLLEDGFDGRI